MPYINDLDTSFIPSDGFGSKQLACRQGGSIPPQKSSVHHDTASREDVLVFDRLQQELDTFYEEPAEEIDAYIYESDSDTR